jgi:PAS domain S-box-containing protein
VTEPAADTAARAAAGSGTGHGRLHRLKRSGLLLFMVIALSVVLVGLQGYVVARSLADYRRAHEDSTVWMAASLDNDILRFEVALLQSLRPAGNAAQPVEAAVRAFDLYYSRLAVVSAMMTRIGPQMADPDGAAAQVASLRADAELIAARIDAGRFAETAVREQLLVRLQQSDDVAHDLANDLLNFAVDLTERRRRISEERLTWLIALTLALTIKLVAVAWYYRWLSRHERERSSALDLLQNTARMSPEAILMTDANGRILWINPAAESLIGLEAEVVIGTPLTRYLAPPQVGASTLAGGFEAWAALGRVSGLLLPVRGRRLPVDVVTVANRGAAGERLFVFFLRDLSDALAQRTAAHKARRNGPPASQAPQPAAQRILVVDDSRPAAEMVAQTLRQMGHAVQEAASGEEAVALATLCPFDTVFLDVQMPGMDGLEAAAHIRAGGQSSRARLVALSASLSPADEIGRAHV